MNNFSKLIALLLFPVFLFSCQNGTKKKQTSTTVVTSDVFTHPSVATFTEQITADPNNASLYFKRAKALRALQEDSIALIDFEKAISLDSTKAIYYSSVGELLFEHKDIEGSVKWFKKAIQIDPKDPLAHLKFAKMLIFVNDNQKAFNEVNTVLRQDPYNAEAYFLKGVVYKNLNDTAKSISSFQTAVQVDPGYQPAILQLALIYATMKDSIALRYFDNAYAADTSQLVALYGKALFYQDNEQPEKAKAIYKACIIQDPQYTDAFFNTGWILMHLHYFEKAVKQYDYVTKIEPTNALAYYNKGLCYELLKKPEQAIPNYKQALEFEPDYKEPQQGLKRLGAK